MPSKPFVPGTTYDHIIKLYTCDGILRDLCSTAVGQFELLFRNAMSEVLSRAYDSHPYVPAVFRDAASEREAIQSLLGLVAKSRDPRILHYCQTYSEPMLPPIWTMKEVLTFGAAAYLYNRLSGQLRTLIAQEFGVLKEPVFQSWVGCLVDLRNMCAHHDRLFNRSFQKQPATLVAAGLPIAPKNKLKALLECLDHLLAYRGSPLNVTADVGRVIARFTEVQPSEARY